MKFDLENQFKLEMFLKKVEHFISKRSFVELKEIKLKRTLNQNDIYWLWLTCIEKETGYDKNKLHVMYRLMFLKRDDDYIEKLIKPKVWQRIKELSVQFDYKQEIGETIDFLAKSTTELEIDEFTRYLDGMRNHARNHFNVILLSLEEKNINEFYKEFY